MRLASEAGSSNASDWNSGLIRLSTPTKAPLPRPEQDSPRLRSMARTPHRVQHSEWRPWKHPKCPAQLGDPRLLTPLRPRSFPLCHGPPGETTTIQQQVRVLKEPLRALQRLQGRLQLYTDGFFRRSSCQVNLYNLTTKAGPQQL